MAYTNGDIFKGEWYENLRTRFGTMAYVNGDTYTGGWGSDGRFANGVLIYANGDKYDGYFHHDKKDGKGILTLAKPDDKGNICYVGNWKDDKMVGEFSCFNGNPVKITY